MGSRSYAENEAPVPSLDEIPQVEETRPENASREWRRAEDRRRRQGARVRHRPVGRHPARPAGGSNAERDGPVLGARDETNVPKTGGRRADAGVPSRRVRPRRSDSASRCLVAMSSPVSPSRNLDRTPLLPPRSVERPGRRSLAPSVQADESADARCPSAGDPRTNRTPVERHPGDPSPATPPADRSGGAQFPAPALSGGPPGEPPPAPDGGNGRGEGSRTGGTAGPGRTVEPQGSRQAPGPTNGGCSR